jgi:predicted metal-dependent HD superfamily phosphohydrolase
MDSPTASSPTAHGLNKTFVSCSGCRYAEDRRHPLAAAQRLGRSLAAQHMPPPLQSKLDPEALNALALRAFEETCELSGVAQQQRQQLWEQIQSRHAGRAYHNLAHLLAMFDFIHRAAKSGYQLQSAAAVHWAVWLHDAVYVPGGRRDRADQAPCSVAWQSSWRRVSAPNRRLLRMPQPPGVLPTRTAAPSHLPSGAPALPRNPPPAGDPSNEAQSAQLARQLLGAGGAGLASELVERVAAHILSTCGHRHLPGDGDNALFLDADLSVLATGFNRCAGWLAGGLARAAVLAGGLGWALALGCLRLGRPAGGAASRPVAAVAGPGGVLARAVLAGLTVRRPLRRGSWRLAPAQLHGQAR